MKRLLLRFKFAWCAFWLNQFEVKWKPYHLTGFASSRWECDNNRRVNKCQNKMEVYLEETWIKFSVNDQNSYLVCKECADKILKTGQEFEFPG